MPQEFEKKDREAREEEWGKRGRFGLKRRRRRGWAARRREGKDEEVERALRKRLRHATVQAANAVCQRMRRATREAARQAYRLVKDKKINPERAVGYAVRATMRVALGRVRM